MGRIRLLKRSNCYFGGKFKAGKIANTKIVLVGDRRLYYLLYEYDPEFAELFKVEADFEDEIARSTCITHAGKIINEMVRKSMN